MKPAAENMCVSTVTAESNSEPGNRAVTTNNTKITGTGNQATEEGRGNTSSCIIELRTVWFNFAAPPHAPITRKIDFTR